MIYFCLIQKTIRVLVHISPKHQNLFHSYINSSLIYTFTNIIIIIIISKVMEIKTFLRIRPVSMANKELYEISEDSKSITIKESAVAG